MTPVTVHDGPTPYHSDIGARHAPQRGHGLLVGGRSDIAHELHDQSRVPERAGGNDGQSASERRIGGVPQPAQAAILLAYLRWAAAW